jgi:transcriptional regulator
VSLYTPDPFGTDDRAVIARLVDDHPFATLLTASAAAPIITHLPLVRIEDGEPWGTLVGHLARANPHVNAAERGPAIAIFQGPHAYVSPSWYEDPAASVPTWNYAVAHVHGQLELAGPQATREILDLMVDRFEAARRVPWQFALDPVRASAMLGAIVGFTLRITRIEAKFKLSQNRSVADRAGVAAGLVAEGQADALATARWMRDGPPR